jgi:hypothetical protein
MKLALSESPHIFMLSSLAMDWSSLERVDCILHELFQEVQLTLQDGELSDLPSPDVL